jgi:hypothetical protein
VSNPKALPELPAILASGDIDCDADPGGEVFAELRDFSVGLPEVLADRRREAATQREAEESAAAIARAAESARLDQRGRATVIGRSKPKPSAKRKITEAQTRTRKIRLWMLKQPSRPDLKTYCQAMDDAIIKPPPVCRAAGKQNFENSLKVTRLKQAISAEFSRLWNTRSPK